jgi:ferredoxin-NADP reductase
MNEETFRFRVDRITPESPRVKTFRLIPEQEELPFPFSPGQHLGVRACHPEAPDLEGETWRHFSLSSSPSERRFLEITVLKQGKVSDRMHALSPGDRVEVTRPVGSFVLEGEIGHGPVFFAGGIGIAPIRSMIRFCMDKDLGEAITLFASFPTLEQAIYRNEMKAWAHRESRVSISITYTGEEADKGREESHPWDRAFLGERIERPLERVYYLCAPRGLMDQVETHLKAMGVSAEKIRRERW